MDSSNERYIPLHSNFPTSHVVKVEPEKDKSSAKPVNAAPAVITPDLMRQSASKAVTANIEQGISYRKDTSKDSNASTSAKGKTSFIIVIMDAIKLRSNNYIP